MNALQDFVTELGDTCIQEDTGYDPLPQHVMVFLGYIWDDAMYQEEFADYLQDESIWHKVSTELLRENDGAMLSVGHALQAIRRAWAMKELSLLVDCYIDKKLGGYIPEEVEFVDEAGGFQ